VIRPKRDLIIDVHSHYDLERGSDLTRRVESLNLFWLEEVTPAQSMEWLATINRDAKMPTAGGETIYGVRRFYPYIAACAVDIVMPDEKYCGGVLELKKIAALAEGAGLRVAPDGHAGRLATWWQRTSAPPFPTSTFLSSLMARCPGARGH
jgi:galactonate dehydratase